MSKPEAFVRVEVDDSVATVTLDRPAEANALSAGMQDGLVDAFASCGTDPDVRVVVVTGAGAHFSAGGDLRTMPRGAVSGVGPEPNGLAQRARVRRLQNVVHAIRSCEKPVLAAVNGTAVGGGCDIALACDIRFASSRAQFGEVFARLGLFPGTGGTYLLPRVVGAAKALELIWTGDVVGADEALRIGLVSSVCEPNELLRTVREFALRLADGPPIALALAKEAVYRGLDVDFSAALDYAATAELITLTSRDHTEGVDAFVDHRPPRFLGR